MTTRRQLLIAPFAFFADQKPIIDVSFKNTAKLIDEGGLVVLYLWIIFKGDCAWTSSYSTNIENSSRIAPNALGSIDANFGAGELTIDYLLKEEFKKYLRLGGFAGKRLRFEV